MPRPVPSLALATPLALATTLALALACHPPPAPAIPPVESPRDPALAPEALLDALTHLLALPRALGHPDRTRSIDTLAARLHEAGPASIERLPLDVHDPHTGTTFHLESLLAHHRPDAPRRFVLATHFDTRPWADASSDPADHQTPIPGANDGTSGLAVVLALAPLLHARLPDEVGFTVILFDGEELGHDDDRDAYCAGSRALAAAMNAGEAHGLRGAELGIVLDMVGDAELQITPDASSLAAHPELMRHVFAVAAARGHAAFVDAPSPISVIDDHTPLNAAGIPSIVLIDRHYPAWHTVDDDLAHVSGDSLAAVADTVLVALLQWYDGA